MNYSTSESIEVEEQVKTTESSNAHELVVFNDEVNTFEHVIEALVDVLEHSLEQAEQCTFLIHHKGQCAVKAGEFEKLVAQRNAICKRGINAEVV